MNRTNWTAVLVFGGVVLVVAVTGCVLLWALSGAFGGVIGPGIMGRGGMMGGWCPWCGGTSMLGGRTLAGFFVLLFIMFAGLGLLGLLIVGLLWLARSARGKELQ